MTECCTARPWLYDRAVVATQATGREVVAYLYQQSVEGLPDLGSRWPGDKK